MSERFNPATEALNTFEDDKRAQDEENARKWMEQHRNEAIDEDGNKIEKFSAEDKQLLSDLAYAYEKQEQLGERAQAEELEETLRQEALKNGEVVTYDSAPEEMPEGESERRRQQEREVAEKAYEDLVATDPKLRRMDRLSRDIEALRNKAVDEDTVEQDERMLLAKEDKLAELLAGYEGSSNFSPAIADYLLDRGNDRMMENAGYDALFKLREKGDAIASTGAESRSADYAPASTIDTRDDETDEDDHEDEDDGADNGPAPRIETSDPETNDGETDDDEETSTVTIGDEGDNGPAPRIETSDPETDDGETDDDEETEETAEQPPVNLTWRDRVRERLRGIDRRVAVVTAIGAAAVAAAVGVYHFWTTKDASLLQGAIGGTKPSIDPSTMNDMPVLRTGIDNVLGGSSMIDTLPPSPAEGYPWDWASEAFPGENPMEKLHELGERAAADNHNVQWHGSGTTEWVEVNGKSATKDVVDILRQYNK